LTDGLPLVIEDLKEKKAFAQRDEVKEDGSAEIGITKTETDHTAELL
jgi:hypothetical protein